MKSIPWKTAQRALLNLPGKAAEHAFLFTLLLIAFAGIFSLFVFTAYGFSSQTKQVQQEVSLYDFKEELFRDTLGVLEERALNLEDAGKKISKDIFNPTELTEK